MCIHRWIDTYKDTHEYMYIRIDLYICTHIWVSGPSETREVRTYLVIYSICVYMYIYVYKYIRMD
jgi:hypothetical protein